MHKGTAAILIYHPNAACDGIEAQTDKNKYAGVKLNLKQLGAAGECFSILWFCPFDGREYDGGLIKASETALLVAPWKGMDVVIYLKKNSNVLPDSTNWSGDLTLPPVLYAVEGKEINIYFDNLISDDISRYNVNVTCAIGIQQNERWTCVPEASGRYKIGIDFYDDALKIVKNASARIIVSENSANRGVYRKLLFIGDSIIGIGAYTKELLALYEKDEMKISLLGTRGEAENRHEGYGGKSINWHFSNPESPFVFDGCFDFKRYMSVNGYDEVDYVFIHLGANDVFAKTTDHMVDEVIHENRWKLETMIENIKADFKDIKIAILLSIPPSKNQDSFGANYRCGQTRWRYKRNIHRYVRALIEIFGERQSENVFLVPENVSLDTMYNMSIENVSANSRNTAKITRQNNGVHPAECGYHQLADSVYYFLKNL